MGLILNGNAPSKILYNGAEVSLYFNGSKIWPDADPYNPLNLPPNTVRVRTNDGNVPVKGSSAAEYETATLVTGTTDVYDIYKSGTNFRRLLYRSTNIIEVLGANTTGITNMSEMFGSCTELTTIPLFDTSSVTDMTRIFESCKITTVPLYDTSNVTSMVFMFWNCSKLTTVPLFNTSSVTNMNQMFAYCAELTSIPLFDTSSVTNMNQTFNQCFKVQSGALALYQQASSQATPPSSHNGTFSYCGYSTTTGATELAQIPSDWK